MTSSDPGLVIRRHDDPREFLARVGPVLSREEALNGLPLGIADAVAQGRVYGDQAPVLVSIEREGEVVAGVVQTPPFGLLLPRVDEPTAVALAAWFHARGLPLPGVNGEREVARCFARAYLRDGRTGRVENEMRLFELVDVTHPPAPGGGLRLAGNADREVVHSWWDAFRREATPRSPSEKSGVDYQLDRRKVWLWSDEGGRPVSLAARNRELPTGASIGPVYTPPEFRGRGYATALVAGLSALILADGKRYACLFTDLANPTSNRIYPKVGYRPIADTLDLRFD